MVSDISDWTGRNGKDLSKIHLYSGEIHCLVEIHKDGDVYLYLKLKNIMHMYAIVTESFYHF